MRKTPLTRSEVFAISKLFEPVLDPDGDGHVKFKDGWDDKRVADEAGIDLQRVQSVRRDVFGELRRTGDTTNLFASLRRRVEALEARVSELEEASTKPAAISRPNVNGGLP